MAGDDTHIEFADLTLAYGDHLVQQHLNFSVKRSDVFVIMGGSGCGKSTVLRSLMGLKPPDGGQILIDREDLWAVDRDRREQLEREMGVLFQSGALWSSMTLAENVELPLELYTDLSSADRSEVAALKLALVGLAGFEEYYPSEVSGGMIKRAGLARAMALDPQILCFDEPSAGLDPISSRRLDELILSLRDSLGTTIVVVTHELASIFTIADDSVFLDAKTRTQLATGNPRELRTDCANDVVRTFLNRGEDKPND